MFAIPQTHLTYPNIQDAIALLSSNWIVLVPVKLEPQKTSAVAQCRVLDSGPRVRGYEPHRRHCVVVLGQDTFILA